MNRRNMKQKLKEFLARQIFLSDFLQEEFLIQQGLLPLTEASEIRFQSVIIELREEWIK